jgi:hypothetical protein
MDNELERAFRDNAALELVLHGEKGRTPEYNCWIIWNCTKDATMQLRVYDYGMVSFGQRIDGRMIWFNVSDTCEQLILETVGAWQR